jgi:hypothetical protein
MRQISNPLFSNPVKESMLRIRVSPMLMGLQWFSGKWMLSRSLTTK